MPELTMMQRFSIARQTHKDSAREVAEKIGCSRQYAYEVLKYPDKNPDLHQKIREYIRSAGLTLPDDPIENAGQPN